ncbi:adenylyltransferase/cytidyltransferase family protein [SAR92 clade bacterium H246]
MKKILTYGTFDCFHIGHLRLLDRASALGDQLYVGVSTDEFNASKGKESLCRFSDRLEIIQSIRCVHKAFEECAWSQKVDDIAKYDIDIFVMGDDWKGYFDADLEKYCEVVYLSRTVGISSSYIREELSVK